MRVLVSCKTTNLDVHGENLKKKISHGILSKEHLHRLEEDHHKHHSCLQELFKILESKNISYKEVGRGLYWPDLDDFDAIISVGGDGTVLEASHHILNTDIPVLGIRSSSMSVGYLCTCDITSIEEFINSIAKGTYKTENLSRLKAHIIEAETGRSRETVPILNDFLFANTNPAATTRYHLKVGDVSELHKSSGIWFATAAGSTAAIRTAGGQEYPRESTNFQYVVREPYTPPGTDAFKLTQGLFKPKQESVEIENLCEHAILALDGQHGQASLTFGDKIILTQANDIRIIVKNS